MKKLLLGVLLLVSVTCAMAQVDANVQYRGITIYIDYADAPAQVSAQQLDSLINGVNYQETGVQRTFRKYWYQQSRRNFDIKHDIFFYRAPNTAAYYSTVGWQAGILMWKDALEWVIAHNPSYNWNALSINPATNGLTSVMIISSSLSPAGVAAAHGPGWTLSNGKYIARIFGTVLKAPWDAANNMFMTLHESGHAIFGFPDTYDTQYDSGGTSFYCLMSGSQPDVEPIGGPFQVLAQFGNVVTPPVGTNNITLKADGDSVIVLRNLHDSLEFFTIEARKKSNIGNSLFPASLGLLIWHSDLKTAVSSNTLQDMTRMKHYCHSIVQADGLYQLERSPTTISGDIGDIYLPGKTLTTTTNPSTAWWDGTASGFEITNIQLADADHISFTVKVPPPHTDHYPEIARTNWKILSSATTPSLAGYDGTKAFDGNLNTYFHVPWGSTSPRPHELAIDLGKPYTINEFYYTANKNDVSPWEGRIQNYSIYMSNDGVNWGNPLITDTYFETGIRQYSRFANTTGRYIKLSAINTYGNDTRTSVAEINLRGFDPSAPASLPITFINVNGRDNGCSATLNWQYNVTGNTELLAFEPQRSDDGNNFQSLGRLSSSATSYTETVPYAGNWLYRVKAISKSGEITYSRIVVVKITACSNNKLAIYPNPTSNLLNISVQGNTSSSYQIINVAGQIVLSGMLKQNTVNTVNTNMLKTGNYVIKVISDGNTSQQLVQVIH